MLNILKVARILKIKDKVKVPTSVIRLDFAPGTAAPTCVYIGFQSFKTKDYIPAPTRCFRCMGLNHVAKHCYQKERCGICAGEHFVSRRTARSANNRSVQPAAARTQRCPATARCTRLPKLPPASA